MSLLQTFKQSVNQGLNALGDAIRPVQVAAAAEVDQAPGQNYAPTWTVYDGRGAFEKITVEDYPQTAIMISDKTLLLFQCARDVEMHDFVKVDGQTYHVFGVKPEAIGPTRILQKLLVRPEPKDISWVSSVPLEV
jgi:hypothetical protein